MSRRSMTLGLLLILAAPMCFGQQTERREAIACETRYPFLTDHFQSQVKSAKIILIGEYHYLPWYLTREKTPLLESLKCLKPELTFALESISYSKVNSILQDVLSGKAPAKAIWDRFDFGHMPQDAEVIEWLRANQIPAFGINSEMWQDAFAEESGLWQQNFDTVVRSSPNLLPPDLVPDRLKMTDIVWGVPWRDDQMVESILKHQAEDSTKTIVVLAGLNHLPSVAARLLRAGVPKREIAMIFLDKGWPFKANMISSYPDVPDASTYSLKKSDFSEFKFKEMPAFHLSFRKTQLELREYNAIYDFSLRWTRLQTEGAVLDLKRYRSLVNEKCPADPNRSDLCAMLRSHLDP